MLLNPIVRPSKPVVRRQNINPDAGWKNANARNNTLLDKYAKISDISNSQLLPISNYCPVHLFYAYPAVLESKSNELKVEHSGPDESPGSGDIVVALTEKKSKKKKSRRRRDKNVEILTPPSKEEKEMNPGSNVGKEKAKEHSPVYALLPGCADVSDQCHPVQLDSLNARHIFINSSWEDLQQPLKDHQKERPFSVKSAPKMEYHWGDEEDPDHDKKMLKDYNYKWLLNYYVITKERTKDANDDDRDILRDQVNYHVKTLQSVMSQPLSSKDLKAIIKEQAQKRIVAKNVASIQREHKHKQKQHKDKVDDAVRKSFTLNAFNSVEER